MRTTATITTEEMLVLPTAAWECDLEVGCQYNEEDRSCNYGGGWELDGFKILRAVKYDENGNLLGLWKIQELPADLRAEIEEYAERWAYANEGKIFARALYEIEASRP